MMITWTKAELEVIVNSVNPEKTIALYLWEKQYNDRKEKK